MAAKEFDRLTLFMPLISARYTSPNCPSPILDTSLTLLYSMYFVASDSIKGLGSSYTGTNISNIELLPLCMLSTALYCNQKLLCKYLEVSGESILWV